MTRVALVVTELRRSGITVAPVAGTSAGQLVNNDGKTWLEVANGHATLARVLTIETPGTVDGQAIADRTVSIPALSSRHIGPFTPSVYNEASGADVGDIYLDFPAGGEADLSVAAYRLP